MDFFGKYNNFVKKIIQANEKKTLYSSILRHKTHSTRLLPSFTTIIRKSFDYIRTLIKSRKKKKTSYSSKRNSSQLATVTRKNRDLGSIFRQETVGLLPSFTTIIRKSFKNLLYYLKLSLKASFILSKKLPSPST